MVIRSGHTEEKQSCPHAEMFEGEWRCLWLRIERTAATLECRYARCYADIMAGFWGCDLRWQLVFTMLFIPRTQSPAASSPACDYSVL